MINRSILFLFLACAVLSGLVGYWSLESIRQAKIRVGPPITMTCDAVLQSCPMETAHIEFEEFIPGKHVALIAGAKGHHWELVCVPLFPSKGQQSKQSYQAVIVCCQGVPDRQALDELIKSKKIDLLYWPERQQLNVQIHSQLAQQYRHMDLVNCPVLHYGFAPSNPVLGETSLGVSKLVGATSVAGLIGVFILTLLCRVAKRVLSAVQSPKTEGPDPVENRAGLPESKSVLDQVTLMRDRSPGY